MKIVTLRLKITTCVLMLSILSSVGVTYATEELHTTDSTSQVSQVGDTNDLPDTTPSLLMDELNPDTFSGIYKDGSEYIIQSPDISVTRNTVEKRRDTVALNIAYNNVKYSLTELREARDKIVPSMNELKIVAVGLDIINNSVSVATMDLSEGNKILIKKLSGIENVVFRQGSEIYKYGEDKINTTDSLNITDNKVHYSITELREARNKIAPYMEELKIFAVGIDDTNNAVSVATMDLSDSNKAIIKELSGIENVVFRYGTPIYNGSPEKPSDLSYELDEDSRAATPVYSGYWASKQTNSKFSSIATSVRSTSPTDSSKGFITCGHQWDQGQPVYFHDQDKYMGQLGEIKRRNVSTLCDAAYISSKQTSTGRTYDGKKISYQGNPIPGDKVYIVGANSRAHGHSVQTSSVISIEEIITPQNSSVTHTNAFSYESIGLFGDSGCAVLTEYAGEYAISGIQTAHMKTNNTLGEGYAIKWNDIKRTLNITAITR